MKFNVDMLLMCLFIFGARICDVSFMSVRTILLTKGMAKLAACCGFFEVLIYIVVLGKVINTLDNPFYLVSYGLGFAAGNFIGFKIENFLAFGDTQMRIILPVKDEKVVQDFRDKGFGVTVFRGEGRDGQRIMLLINMKRKRVPEIHRYFQENNLKGFISTNDITSSVGGYQIAPQRKDFIKILKK